MTVSDEFLGYILDQFSSWAPVTARKMFGGAGLFLEGKMFGLVSDNVVYLKVDEVTRPKYEKAGSLPFKPFVNRPTLVSYYEVPPEVLEDTDELMSWSEESLAIQLQ